MKKQTLENKIDKCIVSKTTQEYCDILYLGCGKKCKYQGDPEQQKRYKFGPFGNLVGGYKMVFVCNKVKYK